MKKTLYYSYTDLPIKVRLISRVLCIDHTIYPNENTYYDADHECRDVAMDKRSLGIGKLFELAKCNLFSNIFIFVDEFNHAYYRNEKNEIITLCGWIDLVQFEDGGDISNDKYEKT